MPSPRHFANPTIGILRPWRRWALGSAMLAAAWLGAGCGHDTAQAAAGGKGSAKLDKPVALAVTGGSCESDGKGDVGANFGNALAFNIGPATVGMPDMSKAPYKGP